ncbi:3'5'-cyclic nucleotide phosphodiesterase family protein [Tritrichomonas foetus]|uniref:3'5'-cyclic nucleotide phosphodiesterase family protein n=1 Tax=Tritrichomonas foetus TaxID=1144522 RepID=A0A1J4KZP3_9EUKA|nr:3'5'-cyclic nucleotide phosphodiesterase family protein [Tritrichomonas foetus]|eukprot:OHT15164.1 3'5'-cyclic nucleotide phosphodiesterase family protein [Tritrichomonas foetus]
MMQNSQDPRGGTSPFKSRNRTKADIAIFKPLQPPGKNNLPFRTQHTPLPQPQKRSQTSMNAPPKTPTVKENYRPSLSREQLRVVNEDLFDQIMENSLHKPLNLAFEPIAKQMFQCEKCVLWIDNPDKKCLVAPTYNLSAGYDNTLPGFIFRTKSVIQVRDPSNAPNGFKSDSKLVPPHSPQLFFALTASNISRAVVQVIQEPHAPSFARTDIETANLIISKFSTYGNAIFTSHNVSLIAETLYSYNPKQISPMHLLKRHFGCEVCEMWQFDTLRGIGQKVIDSFQKDSPIKTNECGIIGDAIFNHRSINLSNASDDPAFSNELDNEFPGPILVITAEVGRRESWAIALRGRSSQFSAADEAQLRAFFPFVLGALTGFNATDEQAVLISQLGELIKTAAKLTSKIANDNIVKLIQSEAMKMLECQNCILFLLNKAKTHLNGHYKEKTNRFQIGKGICSHVIETGEIVSLLNPSDSSAYDPIYDSDSDIAPTSILAAPIRNFNGDIIGCIELLSKTGGDRFTESDQKVLSALNVFIGIGVENFKNYQRAVNLTKKMRSFIEMLLHTTKESELTPMLEEILDKAKHVMGASRVTFFIADSNKLSLFLNVGKESKYGPCFAQIAKEKKQVMIFNDEQINETIKKLKIKVPEDINEQPMTLGQLNDNKFNKVSGIFSKNALAKSNASLLPNEQTEQICCIPLMNQENSFLGVLETNFNTVLNEDDIELLDSFSSIAALSLERISLKQMAPLGYGNLDINDFITVNERNSCVVPVKLALPDDIFTIMFNVDRYDGIDLFKVVFKIFDRFGLMEAYSISNELLFNFLEAARNAYNKIPYHNWRHAIDTFQFVACQIIIGKLDKSYIGQFEILAVLIAALLHDAGHPGFNDSQEIQLASPLCLLYKKQSLLETHHCEKAIEVLTKEDCNILRGLNDADYKSMWTMIIDLIMATDMRRHFKVVQELKTLLNSDEYNGPGDHTHRFLLMKCLLKSSDIAKIVRPLNDAKDWTVGLAEEFFRQGDLKHTPEMIFNSSDEDYAHLDKDASLMGFFKGVCLPLLQVISSTTSTLRSNTEMLKDNIQKWARRTDRAVPNFAPEPK